MVIGGDINQGYNGHTKGSAKERESTQQQNMNMNEWIHCSLLSLCCVINLQILLPSVSGCYPSSEQGEGDSTRLDALHIICLTFWYWAPETSALFFWLPWLITPNITSLLFNGSQNTGQLYVTRNTKQFLSCHPKSNWTAPIVIRIDSCSVM